VSSLVSAVAQEVQEVHDHHIVRADHSEADTLRRFEVREPVSPVGLAADQLLHLSERSIEDAAPPERQAI
jgi:hypothetical protein